jgi:quercetin dioxygenase-like cupin family protein
MSASRTTRFAIGLLLAGLLAGCSATGSGSATAPAASGSAAAGAGSAAGATPVAILREDLGSTLPATATGQRLGLWHYLIQPGAALPPHHHPGWQVARITAGTLTYQIIDGQATVLRANGATELHGAGEVVTLETGDSVVENPDLHHFGANNGSVPVEIYTATLFTDGSPPAIPLPTP